MTKEQIHYAVRKAVNEMLGEQRERERERQEALADLDMYRFDISRDRDQ